MFQLERLSRIHTISLLLLGFYIFTVVGCTVKLISNYDEITDIAISDLQKKVEIFFLTLESQEGLPECEYQHHREFYKDAKASVSSIEVRARAIPENDITIKQIDLLQENIDLLEQLHKIDCLTKEQIEPLRINFNAGFTAILKLELAKKRGD